MDAGFTEIHWLEELFQQHFPGMNRIQFLRTHRSLSLLIVYDLNVVGIAISPSEADTPLVVDSDTILAGPIAPEFLQAIGWWYAKISGGS